MDAPERDQHFFASIDFDDGKEAFRKVRVDTYAFDRIVKKIL